MTAILFPQYVSQYCLDCSAVDKEREVHNNTIMLTILMLVKSFFVNNHNESFMPFILSIILQSQFLNF